MKQAAIYMRVSTQNQEEEQTINNQRIELIQRVADDGNILPTDCEYKDDGWSGTILERPGLDQMRADALDGKFEILYFYDRGRISRRFVHQEIILEGLRDAGVECISLHDINGDSHEERLMGGVMGIFAEYERVKIAERMRIGKYRKVRENKKLLGYNPKYGYNYVHRIKSGPNARDARFVINEEQSEVVKMIFKWAAEGLSKYSIRTELYNNGIMPPKSKNKIWATSVIDRMLVDSTYIGEHYYNKSESVETTNPRKIVKYKRVLKGSRKKRPEEEWMQIKVPRIVEPEMFNKVRDRLAKNKRVRSNNKKHNYLVAGLVDCVCGYARTGDPANGNLYYRCNDRMNHPLGTRACFETGINATVLDDLVWQNVKQLLTQPELVFDQAKKWQQGASRHTKRLESLKEQLATAIGKETRIAQAYANGIMDEGIYRKNFEEISDSRNSLLKEIRAIETNITNSPILPLEKLVDGVIKLVEDLEFKDRRQIVQQVVDKVVATKEEVIVCGIIPVLAVQQVGLNAQHRYRRPAQCRQIDTI
jgi:site-specific DNA recombinase